MFKKPKKYEKVATTTPEGKVRLYEKKDGTKKDYEEIMEEIREDYTKLNKKK